MVLIVVVVGGVITLKIMTRRTKSLQDAGGSSCFRLVRSKCRCIVYVPMVNTWTVDHSFISLNSGSPSTPV